MKAGAVEIVLNNPFRIREMRWPRSLVRQQVLLGGDRRPEEYRLVDAGPGRAVPFQWSGVQLAAGRVRTGTVNFITDLPSETVRRFRLEVGEGGAVKQEDAVGTVVSSHSISMDNGLVRVEIPVTSMAHQPPILSLGDGGRPLSHGVWSGRERPEGLQVEEIARGPVVAEYRLQYRLREGGRYTVLVRCTAGLEFVELEEETEGLGAGRGWEWKLVWDGVAFESRYLRTRPGQGDSRANIAWEPIGGVPLKTEELRHPMRFVDQRAGAEGRLPMKIAPYHNWQSWWRLPSAAFWSERENVTAGVFITDMARWDDRLYSIWASKDDLCVHFHLVKDRLEWRLPVREGTRAIALTVYPHEKDLACVDRLKKPYAHIEDLRRWHGWIPLDRVRNWQLDAPCDQKAYPRFFRSDRLRLEDAKAHENFLLSLTQDCDRGAGLTPVGSRGIQSVWVPSFDAHAGELSASELKYYQAVYAFVAHVYADETLMPMRRMLAGHPNFLADVKSPVGLAAFLFPEHPNARYWADHFEKFLELNLRYHVRPAVKTWLAEGGRWTENLGTYVWAALVPMVRTSYLLHHHFDGRNRIAQPNISLLARWLLHSLAAPQQDGEAGGRRVHPPQGAHALGIPPAYQFRVLGQELAYFDPMTAEHILWATRADDKGFESEERRGPSAWRGMLKGWEENRGTNPRLRPAKFTGYGFVMRAAVDTPEEMTVYLQQIDAGPNYRWGRPARGGNGVIYYYAAGRTYSFNGREDVGDGYFGDVERSTNFGVKKAGGYRSIGPYRAVGQGELTEPLVDFGFAQYARVNANGEAAPEYAARTVMVSGADYIVVHDRVRDESVEGRFSWFVRREDEYPRIHQLRPGVSFSEFTYAKVTDDYSRDTEISPTKGRYYDGRGSFLTVVTHRPEITAEATEYGCLVRCADRTDLVLHRDYSADGFSFEGTSGLVSRGKAALFEGKRIALGGVDVQVVEGAASVSVAAVRGGFAGLVTTQGGARVVFSGLSEDLYVDGVKQPRECRLAAGVHRWQWGAGAVVPGATRVLGTVNGPQGFEVRWEAVPGTASYDVEMSGDGGVRWKTLMAGIGRTSASVEWPGGGKFHVRVVSRGVDAAGPASADYPVYHAPAAPHHPEGLRVRRVEGRVTASWGEVLGVNEYVLYGRRRGESEFRVLYRGDERAWSGESEGSAIGEYRVACRNGFGESQGSEICDTDPQRFLSWDPRPGEGFRRDTESAENGYHEFDHWVEERAPILKYPE